MAQYYWTPEAADLNGAPSNWTVRYGTKALTIKQDGGTSEYYMEVSDTTSDDSAITIDSINGQSLATVGDCEIYLDIYIPDSTDVRALTRFSGTAEANATYRADGVETAGNNGIRLFRSVSGTKGFDLTVSSQPTWPNRYSQRSQTIGTAQKVRWWLDGNAEPGTWQAEATSSFVTQSGRVGLFGSTGRVFRIYAFGIGTAGDPAPTEAVTQTASISAADNITDETGTSTFTLANNTNPPTAARLNGTPLTGLTDLGSGVWQYNNPLIADDATATLEVDVDSTTINTTISYANSYPYELVTHGTPDSNSIFFDTQFASSQPVEWGVVTDYDPSVVTVDHAAMDAAEDELNDVDLHSTEVAAGTSTATYKYFVTESGATGTFQATITVEEAVTQVPQGTITVGSITKDFDSASIPFTYNLSDADSFEHSTDGGSTWATVTSPISRTGLTELTAYSGQIRAVNTIGAATPVSYNFTTDAAPSVPAGSPTVGNITRGETTASIEYSYTVGDNTGIEYSLDGGAWQVTTSSPLALSGFTAGTNHTVRFRAVNDVGVGPISEATFTLLGGEEAVGEITRQLKRPLKSGNMKRSLRRAL